MKTKRNATRLNMPIFIFIFGLMSAAAWAGPPRTLLQRTGSTENPGTSSQPVPRPLAGPVLPAEVSVFYPARGESIFGRCWTGLRIDRDGNVYPGLGSISKILPDGTLVNGVNDQDYFVSNGASFFFELDEIHGKFYMPHGDNLLVAPFVEGSTFSVLTAGLVSGQGITLGQGPLAGSLFVNELAGRVSRVVLTPLAVSVFASGPAFFVFPEAIASSPDGALYVVDIGANPARLIKISPAGVPGTFAVGAEPQTHRMVAVDRAGNVYWSNALGINKYDAQGNLLGILPGPPDKPLYENLMGADFDSKGDLYVVENFGCRKIYRYSFAVAVLLAIKPGSINPRSHGVIAVALLTTDLFDATSIDPLSVRFGPQGAAEAHGRGHLEDADGDGDLDLVLHFRTQESGLQCGSTSASLTGETFEGQTIEGSGCQLAPYFPPQLYAKSPPLLVVPALHRRQLLLGGGLGGGGVDGRARRRPAPW